MTDDTSTTIHWSYWVIAVIGLLWNLSGVANLIGQFDAERVASMPENFRAIVENRPVWVTIAFAVGVGAGALGCVLLLMKKSLAAPVFAVSLLAIGLHMVPQLGAMGGQNGFGFGIFVLTVAMPLIFAAFLYWFALRAKKLGQLT